ncbi:MAG: hypothetical protein MUF27_10000 [Acidobacteria bacterium]|nr:hypothetical protein [Acidobacteriota bacterium]
MRRVVALTLVAAAGLAAALAVAGANLGAASIASGPDPALLRQVVQQERVATGEDASVTEYLVYLRNRILERLVGRIVGSDLFFALIRVLPWVLLAVVALGIGWQLYYWAAGRIPSRGEQRDPQVEALTPERAVAELRAQLDDCLARGDGRGALGALWRLVATTLELRGLGRFAEERTNREFVETVRQAAPSWGRLSRLSDFARTTDRLLYGQHEVGPAAVRALLPVAEELLG